MTHFARALTLAITFSCNWPVDGGAVDPGPHESGD
jgi:hypothetical protein